MKFVLNLATGVTSLLKILVMLNFLIAINSLMRYFNSPNNNHAFTAYLHCGLMSHICSYSIISVLTIWHFCKSSIPVFLTATTTYSSPAVRRTRRCSDLQPDTVSTGLLQRCVVWCSSQQYSEAAACPEHSSEDRHTVAKKGTCSTTAGTVTLASCSSTDRVQAGHTDIQDPSFINPSVPRPSHQIASNFTSSLFLQHAFTAQTYYQTSLC